MTFKNLKDTSSEAMEQKKSAGRIAFLDGMRGLASFAVMLYHFYGATSFSNPEALWSKLTYPFYFGEMGVIAFFVLSGYVIAFTIPSIRRLRGLASYVLKRMLRLDPTYWLIIGASILAAFLVQKLGLGQPNYELPPFSHIIVNMFYLDNLLGVSSIVAVGWTLCFEFQFYLLFSLLTYLSGRFFTKNELVLESILIVSMLLSIGYELNPDLHVRGLSLGAWRFFALGALLSIRLKRGIVISLTFLVPLLGVNALVASLETLVGVLTLISILLCKKRNTVGTYLSACFSSRWFVFLGKISYSLYLVHPLVGNRILYFGSSRFFTADQFLLAAIAFCGAILISIMASYVVYRLVEQPSVRIAQRVYRRLMPKEVLN